MCELANVRETEQNAETEQTNAQTNNASLPNPPDPDHRSHPFERDARPARRCGHKRVKSDRVLDSKYCAAEAEHFLFKQETTTDAENRTMHKAPVAFAGRSDQYEYVMYGVDKRD